VVELGGDAILVDHHLDELGVGAEVFVEPLDHHRLDEPRVAVRHRQKALRHPAHRGLLDESVLAELLLDRERVHRAADDSPDRPRQARVARAVGGSTARA